MVATSPHHLPKPPAGEVRLPALMAAHLPGRTFTSAVDAAEAYTRTTGPMVFAWMHSPRPVAQRACIRAGIEYALMRAEEAFAHRRVMHDIAVVDRRFEVAALRRREAGHFAEWIRFYRQVLAELVEDRAAGLGALFPEAA